MITDCCRSRSRSPGIFRRGVSADLSNVDPTAALSQSQTYSSFEEKEKKKKIWKSPIFSRKSKKKDPWELPKQREADNQSIISEVRLLEYSGTCTL